MKHNYAQKWTVSEQSAIQKRYFLLCNKKSRFDFADELKVADVRYKHLTYSK